MLFKALSHIASNEVGAQNYFMKSRDGYAMRNDAWVTTKDEFLKEETSFGTNIFFRK